MPTNLLVVFFLKKPPARGGDDAWKPVLRGLL